MLNNFKNIDSEESKPYAKLQTHFAFFWIGDDLTIPECLVKSIRHVYKSEAFIYHLTDLKTPHIINVDRTIRQNLPNKMMLARLKAYASIKSDQLICYLDADSLIIKKIYLPNLDQFKAGIVERLDRQQIIVDNTNTFFDINGLRVYEIMPILFGFIASSKGAILFRDLSKSLRTLPQHYHRWFGDQLCLSKDWQSNKKDYLLLEQSKYLYIAQSELKVQDLLDLIDNDTMILTFKGVASKKFIKSTLENLLLTQIN